LRVNADGFETVTSNCVIPEPVKIESVVIDTVDGEYEKELEITISFTDLPRIENYYSLSVLEISTWEGRTSNSSIFFSSNDILIRDENRILDEGRDFFGEAFFDDTILDGKNYKLKIYVHFNDRTKRQINYEIVLASLTKEYYQYLETREAQIRTIDNPFAEPVIIYSNIKNGLGIFSGYSTSRYKLF